MTTPSAESFRASLENIAAYVDEAFADPAPDGFEETMAKLSYVIGATVANQSELAAALLAVLDELEDFRGTAGTDSSQSSP